MELNHEYDKIHKMAITISESHSKMQFPANFSNLKRAVV